MIKRPKYLFFFLVFSFLLLNCSFDNKTGIWAGGEKEKEKALELERQQKQVLEVVKIYSSDRPAIEEVFPVKNTILTQPVKNSSWSMSGLNLQNFTGNIYFNGINKSFVFKRSTIKSKPAGNLIKINIFKILLFYI